MSRTAPRRLSGALEALTGRLAPAGTLARVQEVWEQVVGSAVAAAATPTAERDGIITVTCSASVWAQELELMSPELLQRLNATLDGAPLRALRCRTG
jgi:predicted nucleic acid-binding Zn ribbon protein